MSIKVNGKKFPSPKCPKCGNPTFLRGSVQIISNESKYSFYCPCCEIYAPQANTAEKAAENFEELAKQYKPQEAKNMLELLNGGKGGGIAIGKLDAGTDLNEISAAGVSEIKEQCKKCFHFQVCANVMKNQLFIREKMLKEENPKCEHFAPTEDVAEVKRGKWEFFAPNSKTCTCSVCNISQTVNVYNNKVMFNYCPYCGAKMEG